MLGLAAAVGLTVPPSTRLLQYLWLSNNALTGTIPWNWTLPDSLSVSVHLQRQRACLYAGGAWSFSANRVNYAQEDTAVPLLKYINSALFHCCQ